MREIKAKAFDDDRQVFVRAKLVENESSNWIDERGFDVVWYTGLKDRNGVEIYEGDIVSGSWINRDDEEDLVCEVKFVLGGFCPFTEETGNSSGWLYETELVAENFEVIGNKFESPELLENN